MILSTMPGTGVLGRSGFREVAGFRSANLADLVMRGFAISFWTLIRIASLVAFLRLFTARLLQE
jgi:hypothetical protein